MTLLQTNSRTPCAVAVQSQRQRRGLRRRNNQPAERIDHRSGFTLIETMSVIGITSILGAALISSLFVALQAADTSSNPNSKAIDGSHRVIDMTLELQYTTAITERGARAITVTVPDRDGNGTPESIRYAWSGVLGAPLTRRYNIGAVTDFCPEVNRFRIDYNVVNGQTVSLDLELQCGSGQQSLVEGSILLMNRP